MTTLLFLGTLLLLLIWGILLIKKLLRRQSVSKTLRKIGLLSAAYATLWIIFKIASHDVAVASGTDICFDDWCATITQVDTSARVQQQFKKLGEDSLWLLLHLRVSNHARGIAQKPSEPRIHIIDAQGHAWSYSPRGQQLFEGAAGRQPPIDSRLELHQSLETTMVFAVPANAKGLAVLIEEGPFITNLLFPEDRQVFLIK